MITILAVVLIALILGALFITLLWLKGVFILALIALIWHVAARP